jgi:hypothetical protein
MTGQVCAQPFTLTAHVGPSPDGTYICQPNGTLTIASGTVSWGAPTTATSAGIYLNGAALDGGLGSQLVVQNGGQLYTLGTDHNWYVFGSGGHWVLGTPSPVPPACP